MTEKVPSQCFMSSVMLTSACRCWQVSFMLLSSQSVAIRVVKEQHMLLVWFRWYEFSCYIKIWNFSDCCDFIAI